VLDALVRYERKGKNPRIVAREDGRDFARASCAVVRRCPRSKEARLIDTGGGVVVELDRDGHERYALARWTHSASTARRVSAPPDRLSRASRRERSRSPALSDDETFRQIMKRRDPGIAPPGTT